MKLGLNLGYWAGGNFLDSLALAREADQLGYSVVWAAEAYGSDAATVLGWVAGQTSQIDIGSAVFQIPGRSPTLTAMTAATLDLLSGGRFRLGLGVSGPQVAEGWHGQRFARPLARTREYIEIVNLALSREKVRYSGETYTLPLPDGPGKALQLTLHPIRAHIPIYLAATGPKNVELAGEVADGWLGLFFAPGHSDDQVAQLRAGRAAIGETMDGYDVAVSVPFVIGEDVASCADPVRRHASLYVGGMGSREKNFYNNLASRMGYAREAAEVQQLYLARDYKAAAAAVPLQFIDSTALLGPTGRIAQRMAEFAQAGVTTLALTPYGQNLDERIAMLRAAVTALEKSGVAE